MQTRDVKISSGIGFSASKTRLLVVGKASVCTGVVNHWNRLPRDVADSSEGFKKFDRRLSWLEVNLILLLGEKVAWMPSRDSF